MKPFLLSPIGIIAFLNELYSPPESPWAETRFRGGPNILSEAFVYLRVVRHVIGSRR